MKNKLIRLICLMLGLVFSFSLLVACKDDDDGDDNPNGPADGTGEARFEGVNFGGTKITLMMSNNQDPGRVGASVAKYMTGLEDNGQENDDDVILKTVNDRNKYVKGKLGLEVDYTYTDAGWDTIADVIKTKFDANDGSFGVSDVSKVRTVFANGKALFTTNLRLYDLENVLLSNMKKSLLPFPKVDTSEEYKAYVHDNASVGAIFKNTRRFTEVSAYWQYCSIKSEATRSAYYDKGLGIKYDTSGSGSNNMAMLNILHDKMTIDTYMWDRYITDSNKAADIPGLFAMLYTYANGGEGIETQWASYGNLKVNGLASIKSTYDALS